MLNLSKMKNKLLPTSLQGNYGYSLGEFSNTYASYKVWVFGADRVKLIEVRLEQTTVLDND